MSVLFVFLGGGIGSVSRYLVGELWKVLGFNFPLATLSVNIIGSYIIGFVWSYLLTKPNQSLGLFCITGFLGGFTTFSSFSLETIQLFMKGNVWLGISNIGLNLLFSLLGVYLGMKSFTILKIYFEAT